MPGGACRCAPPVWWSPGRLVAHERHLAAVGRPGGDVERALAAEELRERLNRASARGHQAQEDVLVLGMALHTGLVGEEDDPLAVRGGMREPARLHAGGDLLLVRAVRLHPPDLHAAGP